MAIIMRGERPYPQPIRPSRRSRHFGVRCVRRRGPRTGPSGGHEGAGVGGMPSSGPRRRPGGEQRIDAIDGGIEHMTERSLDTARETLVTLGYHKHGGEWRRRDTGEVAKADRKPSEVSAIDGWGMTRSRSETLLNDRSLGNPAQRTGRREGAWRVRPVIWPSTWPGRTPARRRRRSPGRSRSTGVRSASTSCSALSRSRTVTRPWPSLNASSARRPGPPAVAGEPQDPGDREAARRTSHTHASGQHRGSAGQSDQRPASRLRVPRPRLESRRPKTPSAIEGPEDESGEPAGRSRRNFPAARSRAVLHRDRRQSDPAIPGRP